MICFDVLSNTQGCDFLCGSLPKSIVLNKVKFQGHRQRCNKTEFKKKKRIKTTEPFFFAKAIKKLTTETSVSSRNLCRSILTSWTSPTTITICG